MAGVGVIAATERATGNFGYRDRVRTRSSSSSARVASHRSPNCALTLRPEERYSVLSRCLHRR